MKTQSHAELIARIAESTNTPIKDVEVAYQRACDALRKDAKFHDYLPLFAAKRIAAEFKKSAAH